MVAAAAAGLPALAAAGAGAWKCTSDAGCQLNGICDVASGVCKCDRAWLGANSCWKAVEGGVHGHDGI